MREHHALRLSRGAGCIDDGAEIIRFGLFREASLREGLPHLQPVRKRVKLNFAFRCGNRGFLGKNDVPQIRKDDAGVGDRLPAGQLVCHKDACLRVNQDES